MSNLSAYLIEEDEDLAVIFAQAISDAGFDVTQFGSAAAARLGLAKQVPNLLVLDLNLPGLSEKSILSQSQKSRRLKEMNILVVTANHVIAEELAQQLKPEQILVKPVTYSQLRDLIGDLRQSISK